MWQQLLKQIRKGDIRSLSKAISFVENEQEGYENLLEQLPPSNAIIIGITGPPGAGKSTLTDGLIKEIIDEGKKLAVLCVDPSSPFHAGAVLGDRIRMSSWYTHPGVFIRSLATRGSMGGLHPRIVEITELAKATGFDYIIIETVGVGQSEVEIAGLADTTVVVMVPEAGDDVQAMKAGLMEIADIFVVNKSDRPGADTFVKNLRLMLSPVFSAKKNEAPIIKTISTEHQGISELFTAIKHHQVQGNYNERKYWLLAERAWKLVQQHRMKDVRKDVLAAEIKKTDPESFNLYRFARQYYSNKE